MDRDRAAAISHRASGVLDCGPCCAAGTLSTNPEPSARTWIVSGARQSYCTRVVRQRRSLSGIAGPENIYWMRGPQRDPLAAQVALDLQ